MNILVHTSQKREMRKTKCHRNPLKGSHLDKSVKRYLTHTHTRTGDLFGFQSKKKPDRRDPNYWFQHSHKVCDGVLTVSVKRTAGRQVFPLPLEVMELAVDRRGKAGTRTGKAEELIRGGGAKWRRVGLDYILAAENSSADCLCAHTNIKKGPRLKC